MLACHFCRFILQLFAAFYIVTQTSRIGEYISAFTQMHLPNEVIIPLAVMLRFVPTIQEEWQMVNQALRLRGMALTWKNVLRRPLQMMEYTVSYTHLMPAGYREGHRLFARQRGEDEKGQ